MFDENERGLVSDNRLLQLFPGNKVKVIKRFVPDKEARFFGKASGQFSFLEFAKAECLQGTAEDLSGYA
jgi:hypothetical protein